MDGLRPGSTSARSSSMGTVNWCLTFHEKINLIKYNLDTNLFWPLCELAFAKESLCAPKKCCHYLKGHCYSKVVLSVLNYELK